MFDTPTSADGPVYWALWQEKTTDLHPESEPAPAPTRRRSPWRFAWDALRWWWHQW